ncbi:SDR family NAD(P)-dependent oxidoreductase [Arsenicicoccus sp. oral taxon 190]|uniref:SDR family NAD(P)-dependent oxidoreductase n=1 Tax=Arsenicicoccus sp. oral taxon 190 TaxID=1658671 RepID=UPI000679FF44|nr:SDR family oxidoreductase [Arsenicicoccus sp. oral taxon 190]AKT50321.1 short-chain dehydrogenase [Arsenicicoccus sp. oral taxon 190]
MSNDDQTTAIQGRTPVAVVAGASRGLGLLVARDLGERGFRVVLLARNPEELDAARNQLRGEGIDAHSRTADVTDHARLEAVIEEVEREVGPITVAIHVAGVIQVGPLAATRREHFEQAIDIMLWGPVNLALAVLPVMRERRRGRIGVVTSIGGKISVPHLLPYSTAKFGAVGFTEGLAAELAGTGVTATTIVPGLMRTGSHLQAQFIGDQAKEYAWFAPGASLPLVSMSADRAAHQMVEATLAGDPVALLSPLSKVGARVAGLAPATTTRLLGLMARVLPSGTGDGQTITGHEARERLGNPVVEALTVLGNRAARRNNEHHRA